MNRQWLFIIFSLILCGGFITTAQQDDAPFCKSLIAFAAQSDSHTGYFLLDPNTGDTTQIMEEYGLGLIEFTNFEWSSDGSRLLVTAFDPVVEGNWPFGYIYDIALETVTRVTPQGNTGARWSPDERFIAGTASSNISGMSYQINITAVGSDEEPPLLSIDDSYAFRWATDSPTLYYFNDAEHTVQSIDMSAVNPEPVDILSVESAVFSITPSPDGDILLIEHVDGLDMYTISTGELNEVVTMRPRADIDWLEDGESYVFIDTEIYLIDRSGTDVRSLTAGYFGENGAISTDSVRWAELGPQEEHVLLNPSSFQNGTLYVIPLRQGYAVDEVVELFQVEGGWIEHAAWSPCLDTDN